MAATQIYLYHGCDLFYIMTSAL